MTPNGSPVSIARFLLTQVAIGFVLAGAFVAWIIIQNVHGLGALITNTDLGWFAAGLLWFFAGSTFSAAQIGFSIMMHADDEDQQPAQREPRIMDLKPIPVRSRSSGSR
ncbi:MAG: hypothetical protein AAGA88_14335 [Pseudomonadota bacterium]